MLWLLLTHCFPGAPRQLPCPSIPLRAETWQLITLKEATGPTPGSTQARPQVKGEAAHGSQSPAHSSSLPTALCLPCRRPLQGWGQGKREGCWWAPIPQTQQGDFCPFPLALGLPSQNNWGYPWGIRAVSCGSQPSAPPRAGACGYSQALGDRAPYAPQQGRAPGSAQAWHSPRGLRPEPASALTDLPSFTSKELSCYPSGISRAVTWKNFCQKKILG